MAGRIYLRKLCITFDPLELGLKQGETTKIRFPKNEELHLLYMTSDIPVGVCWE
jgi:hypothetical protein